MKTSKIIEVGNTKILEVLDIFKPIPLNNTRHSISSHKKGSCKVDVYNNLTKELLANGYWYKL